MEDEEKEIQENIHTKINAMIDESTKLVKSQIGEVSLLFPTA